MGNKSPKTITKEEYQDGCSDFIDFITKEKTSLKIDEKKNKIINKIKEKEKISIIYDFIKDLLKNIEKEKILNQMMDVFEVLIEQYEFNHKKEDDEDDKKKFFYESISDNEKNIINAIYISKLFDNDEVNIHDYAESLYDEDEVEKIENGNNKYINEEFKKYDTYEPQENEIKNKFKEICEEINVNPEEYNQKESKKISQESKPEVKKEPEKKSKNKKDKIDTDNQLVMDKYDEDEDFSKYYDIIFDIDSLENLKVNGWKFYITEEGIEKNEKKKNGKNTVVSVIGNKNKGKSFILSQISNNQIPVGHNITTKGLSVIYPDYAEKNIICLDTAGFEVPLCEDDEIFKFETTNKKYIELLNEKKSEQEKKQVPIKDYLSEEEYINQLTKFIRDRQNTDYFLQKFILNSADILLCVVNELNLSDQKFLNRIQEQNKTKKIFIIHNLKTFKQIEDVKNYINNTLLRVLSFKLRRAKYIMTDKKEEEFFKDKNIEYYRQIFDNSEENKTRQVIHLFLANSESEAGKFYNDSTISYIKTQITAFTKNDEFPIIDKVKEFLIDHSGEFFNNKIDKDSLKEETEPVPLLKYEGESYELKKCYFDELGNTNFIQTSYVPKYKVYIANYKKENNEPKLFIDVLISGNISNLQINYAMQNKQNIFTITGNRELINNEKEEENIKNSVSNNTSCFKKGSNMFNLRIIIPIKKCHINGLIDESKKKGLYRFIYNIKTEHSKKLNISYSSSSSSEEEEDEEEEDEEEEEEEEEEKKEKDKKKEESVKD